MQEKWENDREKRARRWKVRRSLPTRKFSAQDLNLTDLITDFVPCVFLI